MSSGIVRDFFPDLTALLHSRAPALWQHVFPDRYQHQCPELSVWTAGTRIRNPWLLPIMLLACAVGIAGCLRLRRAGASTAASSSFLCFACMNAAACVTHCFTAPRSPKWELFAGLDACFTGCAALLASIAFLLPPRTLRRLPHLPVYTIATIFAVYIQGRALQWPFTREAIYLALTIASAGTVAAATARKFLAGQATRGLAVACLGVLGATNGLTVDQQLCMLFGSAVNHMHVLFTASALIFYGLEEHFLSVEGQAAAAKCE